jgi:hypothetical protein
MRRIGIGFATVLLIAVGVVLGWFAVGRVLALPVPEWAMFAITGVVAVGTLVGAYYASRWWARAPLVGGFVGVAMSVALVLLVVKS